MEAAVRAESELDFVEEFASAADWFARSLSRTSSRAPVPGLSWSVLDLAAHVGNIHSWSATVVETGEQAPKMDDQPPSGRSRRLSEWYLAKAEDLYEVLRTTDPRTPCWNFASDKGDAHFWARRQAHEVLVHGLDLAAAGGHEERLPVVLASDAVQEVLEVFLPRMHRAGKPAQLSAALELHATDVDRRWLLEPVTSPDIPTQQRSGPRARDPWPTVSRGSSAGADRVEAPVGVLLKVLWHRIQPSHPDVTISGDEDRVLRFLTGTLTA